MGTASSLIAFRPRPDWQALLYQQGLGLVVAGKLIDGLIHGRAKLYSGDYFPWARKLPVDDLPAGTFWVVLTCQAVLLLLYLARVRPRLTAGLLALALLFDTLVSFQNHRLLLVLLVALVALKPVPKRGDRRDQHVYWNLDLVGWLLAVIYFVTALHKATPSFLSGEALQALFHYVHTDGGRHYPAWLYAALQDLRVCQALAIGALLTEVGLALALLRERTVGWAIPAAIGLHLGFFLLMPYIWVFSLVMILNQVAFLPARVQPGLYRLRPGAGGERPRLAALLWPGAVEASEPTQDSTWALVRPDGTELTGYEAWVELASLSPLLFLFAETLRIAPARWLGTRRIR